MRIPRYFAFVSFFQLFPSLFGYCGETSHFKKAVVVILENTDIEQAIEQPFMKSLISRGALLSNYQGLLHPSQPNYIALVGGEMFGVKSNDNVDIDAKHLGDLLEAKGLEWKTYAEDYPGGCYLKAAAGIYRTKKLPYVRFKYTRKHVPFLSFKNVQSNAARCGKIQDGQSFDHDLGKGTLPDFALYIPNNENNGHDTGVEFADQWLSKRFSKLVEDEEFLKDRILVITFDEGVNAQHIYTVIVGAKTQAGSRSEELYTNYNLLKTIETNLGLGDLGKNDQKAAPIEGIWKE